jgi:hypothetical protein
VLDCGCGENRNVTSAGVAGASAAADVEFAEGAGAVAFPLAVELVDNDVALSVPLRAPALRAGGLGPPVGTPSTEVEMALLGSSRLMGMRRGG